MEKEKLRLEEEKEMRRIEEHNRRMQAELEEEERKKRAKEEASKQQADEASQRLADEKKSKGKNRKFPRSNTEDSTPAKPPVDDRPPYEYEPSQQPAPYNSQPAAEFRSNSPPVPAAAKKMNGGKPPPAAKSNNMRQSNANFNTPADYYTTESRLNLASPVS